MEWTCLCSQRRAKAEKTYTHSPGVEPRSFFFWVTHFTTVLPTRPLHSHLIVTINIYCESREKALLRWQFKFMMLIIELFLTEGLFAPLCFFCSANMIFAGRAGRADLFLRAAFQQKMTHSSRRDLPMVENPELGDTIAGIIKPFRPDWSQCRCILDFVVPMQ